MNLDDFETFANKLYHKAMEERYAWGDATVSFAKWYKDNMDFLIAEYKDTRGTGK